MRTAVRDCRGPSCLSKLMLLGAAATFALRLVTAPPTAWIGSSGASLARTTPAKRPVAGKLARHAKEPWKPLVFKMPRKKPSRDTIPDDDGFTTKMRQRLKDMELTQEKSDAEARAVSETKADDLISKEFDDAKISANYALWVSDRTLDAAVEERDRPDLEVWKRRYSEAAERLDQPRGNQAKAQEAPSSSSSAGLQKGRINVLSMDSMDDMIEQHAETMKAQKLQKKMQSMTVDEAFKHSGEAAVSAEDEKAFTGYLETLQARSATEDRISKRVVKSPQERKEDYEETKGSLVLATAGSGLIGTVAAFAGFGVNEAFSFGLGSLAALLYISGLSSYTDNAESPVGMAVGGRRFLVPVLLLLIVIQWDTKLEVLSPELASLGLDPVLPAAILGFFTYNLGKVLSGLLR